MDSETKYIAVCTAGIDLEYNDSMLKAVYSQAADFNFKILFFSSFSSLGAFEKQDIGESNIFGLINYDLVDGVIILSETFKTDRVREEIIEKSNEHGLPVISLDCTDDNCYNVNFQYKNGMKNLVRHLIEKHGCRRLNFIAGLRDNSFSEERLDAYREVLEEYGIPFEEKRVGYGGFCCEPAEEVVQGFMDDDSIPFPQAIVCANDSMAIGAIKRLRECGYHVPEDVAVTGFDGIREAVEYMPVITTSKHDYNGVIRRSMEVLAAHFRGENPPRHSWVDTKPVFSQSCGCEKMKVWRQSTLARELYDRIDRWEYFQRSQIALGADLADNDTFQGVFDNLKKYVQHFCSDCFWLCIVDDFLDQKENLMDIIEESSFKRTGYSSVMNIMLSRYDGEWQGMTDFRTASLLPRLEQILEEKGNVMFLPLHVQEQTLGYVALIYDPDKMNMYFAYQFFMNISNCLENTKVHQRQQAIIDNLELKYIHDPMTGLYNRRGFYQRLETVYSECVDSQKLLGVVSVDLNDLKTINDTFGHADGDIAITTIGRALVDVFPSEFTCARFGGDEFVASGRVGSMEMLEEYCEKVKDYLADFNGKSGKPYKLSSSIGFVAGIPDSGVTLDEFIKAADEKMYEDKAHYHSRSR